jgi:glycosyltransferase involved in cell wall biosynthesis
MTKPLVSAITIFLNAERFMHEAVASVLAQTYDNWELLLVDDGSTDGSTALAHRYAARHPRQVQYLQHDGHQNRGMSVSRNLGIRHARGKYIAFLDADDVWLPHKLERQLAALGAQPAAGMVCGQTEYWSSWTQPDSTSDGQNVVYPTGLPGNTLVTPPALLIRFLRNQTRSPGTCSVLLRREVVDVVGGFEEHFRGMYEDQAFFAKVCLLVPVLMMDGCSARYRQHGDSCYSRAKRTGMVAAAERTYLTWLARYVWKHPDRGGEAWEALHDILWPYRYPLLHRLSRYVLPAAPR